MGSLPYELTDIFPGGQEAWRQNMLHDPNAVHVDSDVFSPPMLNALGAVSLSPDYPMPERSARNVITQQQSKEGDT